jgi:Cys-tRNA(Pro) deacylase
MGKIKPPVTAAVRALRQAGVDFADHPYTYLEGGGTAQFCRETGADEHTVIKTLVMQDENAKPLLMLMHGDKQVSTKELARQIDAKAIIPCDAKAAQRHTGYKVGGTSPFGTLHPLPVYCESSISGLPRVFINGGKRGYIISLNTQHLLAVLKPRLVTVARD